MLMEMEVLPPALSMPELCIVCAHGRLEAEQFHLSGLTPVLITLTCFVREASSGESSTITSLGSTITRQWQSLLLLAFTSEDHPSLQSSQNTDAVFEL